MKRLLLSALVAVSLVIPAGHATATTASAVTCYWGTQQVDTRTVPAYPFATISSSVYWQLGTCGTSMNTRVNKTVASYSMSRDFWPGQAGPYHQLYSLTIYQTYPTYNYYFTFLNGVCDGACSMTVTRYPGVQMTYGSKNEVCIYVGAANVSGIDGAVMHHRFVSHTATYEAPPYNGC